MERKSSYGVIDCDTSRRELMVKTGGVNDKAARKTYNFDMVSEQGPSTFTLLLRLIDGIT